MRAFDLAVIGAGPGGYVAAIRAAQLGMKVVVAEKEKTGGVCVNRGCIPSKAILKAAETFEAAKDARSLGIRCGDLSVDYGAVIRRSRQVADRMSQGVSFLFRKNGIELVPGVARLLSPGRLSVGDMDIGAKYILVAAGTAPKALPGIEPDGDFVITSDDALTGETLPRSVVILGGGAVGIEFAYIYRTFGADVTIVEMEKRLLPRLDGDAARELEKTFAKRGIRVMTSTAAKAVDRSGKAVVVTSAGTDESLATEKVLVAAGRKPCTEGLGLEALGVKLNGGYIEVDRQLRTGCPSVFAVGDVIGGMLLAHEASAEGIAAVESMAGHAATRPERDDIPTCVFCQPEVASVGMTAEEARRRGIGVKVSKFPFSALGRAVAAGHTEGFVKIVVGERYGEILGCTIIGRGATDLIAEVALARALECTWQELGRTVHAHPTLSEAIREAALMAGGEAIDV